MYRSVYLWLYWSLLDYLCNYRSNLILEVFPAPLYLVIITCFWNFTLWYSWITPDSTHRDHSWCCSGNIWVAGNWIQIGHMWGKHSTCCTIAPAPPLHLWVQIAFFCNRGFYIVIYTMIQTHMTWKKQWTELTAHAASMLNPGVVFYSFKGAISTLILEQDARYMTCIF